MKQCLGLLCIFLVSATLHAREHAACANPGYELQNPAAQQLRVIAASCRTDAIANLYYNRAYHLELLQEGHALYRLASRDIAHHLEAYRLYIALIEAFAPGWYPDIDARVAFLNREYDRRGEIAELRLHGYDHLATAKEKASSVP